MPIKVRKKAKIRNRYNKIPHMAQDTISESDKQTRKHHIQDRSAISQQVSTRLKEPIKTVIRQNSDVSVTSVTLTLMTNMRFAECQDGMTEKHETQTIKQDLQKKHRHARIQKVLSEGVQHSQRFFKLMRGREDPNTTINGPSSARQRNAIKWRFAGVPMMAQH